MLGESCHGVNDFNVIKFRLIRFLHEEMGYEVLVFESNIGDCFYSEQNKGRLSGYQMMFHSIYPTWWVESNCKMFDYIIEHNMKFSGLDIQPSGVQYSRKYYDDICIGNSDLANKLYYSDSLFYYLQFQQRNQNMRSNKDYGTDSINNLLKNIKNTLIVSYKDILSQISLEINNHIQPLIQLKTLKIIVENKIAFVNREGINFNTSVSYSGKRRDDLMAKNLEFIFDSLYPNRKIIVWAHNGHIVKQPGYNLNKKTPYNSMGSLMSEKIKAETYYMGMFALGGENWSYPENIKLNKACKKSVEAILYNTYINTIFLNIADVNIENAGSAWLFEPVYNYDHGETKYKLHLNKGYDGILFLSEVSPSKLLKYVE